MTRPDLDDESGEDEFVDGSDKPSQPWHNSTRAVIGATAAGIAVIGVLVAAVMFVSGGDDPPDAPVNFVDPSFSETAAASSAMTTTNTITSTPKLSTTEINAPPEPSTTSGTSDTSSSDTSSSSSTESASAPTFTRPRPRQDQENTGGPTSRTRPRLNVTRTLGPG